MKHNPYIKNQHFPSKLSEKNDSDHEIQTLVRPKVEVKEPPMYKVLLLNDDYTPMDFVVFVLKKFFKKNETEATQIMLSVHNQGAGLAGIYPQEIAESKVFQVNNYSKKNEHPLKCIIEEEKE